MFKNSLKCYSRVYTSSLCYVVNYTGSSANLYAQILEVGLGTPESDVMELSSEPK